MELSPSEVRKLFMVLGDFTWITNEASSFRETTFNRRSDLVQKKKKKKKEWTWENAPLDQNIFKQVDLVFVSAKVFGSSIKQMIKKYFEK